MLELTWCFQIINVAPEHKPAGGYIHCLHKQVEHQGNLKAHIKKEIQWL